MWLGDAWIYAWIYFYLFCFVYYSASSILENSWPLFSFNFSFYIGGVELINSVMISEGTQPYIYWPLFLKLYIKYSLNIFVLPLLYHFVLTLDMDIYWPFSFFNFFHIFYMSFWDAFWWSTDTCEDIQHHSSSGKCKSKPQWDISSPLSEWLLWKRKEISVGPR